MSRRLPLVAIGVGCPDPAAVAVGGESDDDGTSANGAPIGVGIDDGPRSGNNGGYVELPSCWREEAYGPDTPSRNYICVSTDRRYSEAELVWRRGEPTPAGPYGCRCDGTLFEAVDAESCEAALEASCRVDFEGPLACGTSVGMCWPREDDPGGWRCRCGEGAPLVETRSESCELAAFTTCNGGGCSDTAGRCTPRTDGVGHDCECANGERLAWPGVWDCESALSTCKPSCTSGSGRCALREHGHACECAGGGSGSLASIFLPESESYGLCRRALELSCGPPPAGESCSEDADHGVRSTCTSDGTGAWDCDCAGNATHVMQACPLPAGEVAAPYSNPLDLPQPRDRTEIPDEIELHLYTCIDAVFSCACE